MLIFKKFTLVSILSLNFVITYQNDNLIVSLKSFINQVSLWKPHADIGLFTNNYFDETIRLKISILLSTEEKFQILLNKSSNFDQILIHSATSLYKTMEFLKYLSQNEYDRKNISQKFNKSPIYFILWPEITDIENFEENSILKSQNISLLFRNFSLGSDIYLVLRHFDTVQIVQIYSINSVVRLSKINFDQINRKASKRGNLTGIQIRAAAPEQNLTQGEIVWNPEGTQFVKGFGVEIFKSLQIALNFESMAIPTQGWATLFQNGSWNGMALEILEGRADIGIAKTSILEHRAKSLTYLVPIHTLIVTAFFKQPSINSVRNIFLLPFQSDLWIGVLLIWIIILVCIFIVNLIKGKFECEINHFDDIIRDESFIWIFGAICQQGWHLSPNSMSMRIIFLFGTLLGLIVFVAYAATLISLFSLATVPIKSMSDLLHSPITLLVDQNNAGAKLVVSNNSADSTVQLASNLKLLIQNIANGQNSSFISALDGTRQLLHREIALLTFIDSFYSTIKNAHGVQNDYLCKHISSLPVTDIPFRSGLFIAKNSPYKEIFNIKINTIFTSGLLKRYQKDYENSYTPICSNLDERHVAPSLNFSDILSAFILLFAGYSLALIILILEKLSIRVTN